MNLTTTKEVWDQAIIILSGANNMRRVCNLLSEFFALRKEILSEYYATLLDLCDQLDMYQPFTTNPVIHAKKT